MATTLKKITPHLWYNQEAKSAAQFYVSIFPESKIKNITTLNDTPSGTVEIISFELSGHPFMAMNAGPLFKFNESISFMVQCDTQEEIDYYWNALSSGGQEQPCGWLKDKFGLSWQIIPSEMDEMLQNGTPEQIKNITEAFLKMTKFNLAELRHAYNK
mgnify:CR=1 FL=1